MLTNSPDSFDDENDNDSSSSEAPLVIVPYGQSQSDQPLFQKSSTHFKKASIISNIVLLIICFCLVITTTYFAKKACHITSNSLIDKNEQSWFFHISDIHFDIYYNETVATDNHCRLIQKKDSSIVNFTKSTAYFGRVKCDTPLSLLSSLADAIEEINNNIPEPFKFILLTGDQSAHNYKDFKVDAYNSILWSIVNSTYVLHNRTQLPVLMTIGNNDLPSDYEPPVDEKDDFYTILGDRLQDFIFPPLSKIGKINNLSLFHETFNKGGFYAVNISEQIETIMLNTNYWSSECFKYNPRITSIGDLQLKWLESTLKQASFFSKKVLLCGHIPPGVSTYKNEGSLWLKNYTDSYVKLLYKFEEVIIGQFYGHVHKDKIKIQNLEDVFELPVAQVGKRKPFLLMAPSITPVYANNPAFRLVSYNKETLKLSDYTQYYMDMTLSNVYSKTLWKKEYSFSEMYSGMLNSQTIQEMVANFVLLEKSTWFSYMSHMSTKYGGKSTKDIFREYCSAQHVSLNAYNDCLSFYQP